VLEPLIIQAYYGMLDVMKTDPFSPFRPFQELDYCRARRKRWCPVIGRLNGTVTLVATLVASGIHEPDGKLVQPSNTIMLLLAD
jgi:hypothetical protein